MKKKYLVFFLLSALICFLANFFKHNPLLVIFLNTLLFLGYANLFKEEFNFKSGLTYLPFLALMPIFTFNHQSLVIYFVEFLVLISWYLFTKIKKKSFIIGLVSLVIFLYFTLLSSHIILWPFKFDNLERLIYPQEPFQVDILRQQKEALYFPYQLRLVVFSNLTSYTYDFFNHLLTFTSLENLYRTLTFVNIVLLVLGLASLNKLKPSLKFLVLSSLFIALIPMGLIKTPDTLTQFSPLRGIFLLLIINGFKAEKLSWPIFLSLFILSVFLNLGFNLW